MSFYVSRIKETGERAWVGPIRSAAQAQREARAWIDCGRPAEVVESSTEVKREVRAWQRAMDVKHGRVKVYGKAG